MQNVAETATGPRLQLGWLESQESQELVQLPRLESQLRQSSRQEQQVLLATGDLRQRGEPIAVYTGERHLDPVLVVAVHHQDSILADEEHVLFDVAR